MTALLDSIATPDLARKLRIGFLGLGWIGRHRMQALLETGKVEIAGLVEPSEEMRTAALALAPDANVYDELDDLLAADLDGIMIATPSALHADQAIRALQARVPVFCQKPLGRSADEVRAVIKAAAINNVLLAVDMSYRYAEPMQQIRTLVKEGSLGRVFSADLIFHNAYGPDKPWFYDKSLSGGGCVIDLAIHLIDLALWALDYPEVEHVTSHLLSDGVGLSPDDTRVEDFAVATLTLAGGVVVRLTCSWRLHAGCEAVISAGFHGTEGGAILHNVEGSFYRLAGARFSGTSCEKLESAQKNWGGLAALAWMHKLTFAPWYDPECASLVASADAIDRIYGCRT